MDKLIVTKLGVVVQRGDADAWDGGMVESPMVWLDSKRRHFVMAYVGYRWHDKNATGYESVSTPNIGLAHSSDLVHWTKHPENPVFGPDASKLHGTADYDRCGAAGPFVVYYDDLYYLLYFGTTEDGYERGTKSLNVATSPDLAHWRRYSGNPVVRPEGTGWRSEAIWHPNVIPFDGRFYLFFNATGTVDGSPEERIGVGVSDNVLHWHIDDERSPVMSGSGIQGAWDSTGRAGDPCVLPFDDRWVMAYYSWNGKNAQDGLAWTTQSEFPYGWRALACNPVLRIGSAMSFDAMHAGKPFVIRHDDYCYHFYTAVNADEQREIALARWDPAAVEAILSRHQR